MTKTIVMIHGMWCGSWYWEYYKDFFEGKGYSCVVPNLRYHDVDPSEPPHPRLGKTSLLDYAEDLEKEVRRLDTPPILMGHSMGGLLAQILASRGLAEALVLLTPASPRGIMALKPSVIKSFWSVMRKWGFWGNSMRITFDEAVYSILNLIPAEERRKIYDKFVFESGRAAAEIGFWLFDSKAAAKVDESRVTCPVLVVAGTEDKITPKSVVRKVAKKYGAVSTHKEFENHAHWVIGEPGWDDIAGYVDGWLNKVLSGHSSRF